MRVARFPLLLAVCWGAALAQTASQTPPQPLPAAPELLQKSGPPAAPPKQRADKRIVRIHVEDGGSRIDELRYGGETQSITVQPKLDVPAYEMLPADGARSRPTGRDGSAIAPGQRVWNVLNF